ncbi:hypothetical protein EDB80DRAFT_876659 [Ilyonectria destructans]|nr:hypothetical protein EDB80DRAFT_876659 [Ilyonectria destructans]
MRRVHTANYEQKIATIKNRAQQIPDALSELELNLLERLVALQRDISASYVPRKILIYTDIRRDPDDQNAFLALILLEKLGFIQIIGVITTSPPTRHRARFAKALLEEHGLSWIPVAAGIDYKADDGREGQFDIINGYEFNIATQDGPDLAAGILKETGDRKDITLLCIAPTFDVAETFRRYPRCYQGVERFILQSGASLIDGDLRRQVDTDGKVVSNYNADGDDEIAVQDSTDFVFQYLQRHGTMDCIFLSKEAAAKAQIPGMLHYEQLRKINDRIHTTYNTTKELYKQQQESLIELLADVVEGRRGLLTWRNFVEPRFFNGKETPEPRGDLDRQALEEHAASLVPNIQTLVLYDAVAALCTVPPILDRWSYLTGNHQGEDGGQRAAFFEPSESYECSSKQMKLILATHIPGNETRSIIVTLIKGAVLLGPEGV